MWQNHKKRNGMKILSKKGFLLLIIIFVVSAVLLRPPVNGGRISSRYGTRVAFERNFHNGTDIALPTGSPVNSTSWGTVKLTGYDERSGNYIIITHLPGIESRYLHLDSINVNRGQGVNPRTIIGTVGNTGLSTGPHLHFEIRVLGIPLPPYILILPGRIVQRIDGYSIIYSLIKT